MLYPRDFTPELRRKPICGVLSVAMIAGVSFARATQVIKENMMPFQKRHGGKTYHMQRWNSLYALGVRCREISCEKMTLRRAVDEYCKADTTYMITTSSHVVTVRNGIVADQTEIKHIDDHHCGRYFTRHILEVLS